MVDHIVNAKLNVFAEAEQTFDAAARAIVEAGTNSIARSGSFFLVLSGGGTPARLYELLATRYADELDWRRVLFFWSDERHVPPHHKASNYHLVHQILLRPLGISDSQVHRIRGELADAASAARDYERTIARVLGAELDGPPPAFDLVLLGMGGNGHTASLFPHTEALREKSRWVVANRLPQFDTVRITMTPVILNRARRVLFLVVGAGKAHVLSKVLKGPRDAESLPAQLIRPVNAPAEWFCDKAAAGSLRSGY